MGFHSAFVLASGPEEDRAEIRAFAMAAAVLGVKLRPFNDFVEKRRMVDGKEVRTVEWYLEQTDPLQRHKSAELLKWWNDLEWLKANTDHPLALLKEYWTALKDAEQHEKDAVPIAVVCRGKKYAFIPYDCPQDRKQKLLKMLEE